ncbi:hypothetical protein ACFSSF_15845 [Dietzia aerolata]|uniref:hypothetical protein n=1 Tax=Dietzia aerolata TaxID=595984 RepID=UPI00362CCA4B
MSDLPPRRQGESGLFHTAVLFDDEASLSAAVASVARLAPRSFTGSSDHLYSQAFYFDDPEGNGVELYADRPRETWTTQEDGLLEVATNPLDPNEFLRTHLPNAQAGPPRRRSATCTYRSAISGWRVTSTWTPSGSRSGATWARHCSSRPAGTTTTSP